MPRFKEVIEPEIDNLTQNLLICFSDFRISLLNDLRRKHIKEALGDFAAAIADTIIYNIKEGIVESYGKPSKDEDEQDKDQQRPSTDL